MKLSIIIVHYNTYQLLKQCLHSLWMGYKRELKNKQYEVLVIDNASSDRSINQIKNDFPWIKFRQSRTNFGFGKANNKAAKEAAGDFILFLNPDTIVPKKTLASVIDYLEKHPDVAIATCKVILQNGELDDACHRGFPTPWRALTYFLGLAKLFPWTYVFNGYHLGYRHMQQIHEIEACAGAFLMIRRQIWQQVGYFDEDYFWYGEDLDLCFRVKKLGYKIMFLPEVYITHFKGAASGIKKHSQYLSLASQTTIRLAQRSRFEVMRIFYRKHYQNVYPNWLTRLVFWGIDLKEKITQIGI